MRLVIIGGSDAGISAALRARELDSAADITVMLADDFPNYSICGLPFYLSHETPDWHQLAHRTEFEGIELLPNHRAQSVDPSSRNVSVFDDTGREKRIGYDRLLIATGARPVIPPIPGMDQPGAYPLHTMEDNFRVSRYLTDRQPRSAVIVGSGYIGLEMADALTHRGLEVTLIGRSKTVLPTRRSGVRPHPGREASQPGRPRGKRLRGACHCAGSQPASRSRLCRSEYQRGAGAGGRGRRAECGHREASRPANRGKRGAPGQQAHGNEHPGCLCRRGLRRDLAPAARRL